MDTPREPDDEADARPAMRRSFYRSVLDARYSVLRGWDGLHLPSRQMRENGRAPCCQTTGGGRIYACRQAKKSRKCLSN